MGRRRLRGAAALFPHAKVRGRGFGAVHPMGLSSEPMKRSRIALSLLLLTATSVALATTYVRVEKDGTKTYSDRPIPGGVPVEVEPVQTYQAPPSSPSSSGPAEQRLLQEMDDFKYATCTVTPANDETFTNPENVPISVTIEPALRPRDTMTLAVDGAVVATNLQSWLMKPVDRGTHSVVVEVKDQYGRVLCNATASFHVMRPSVNMPRRR
jgi:hypothetical protein